MDNYLERLKRLQTSLKRKKLSAFLVTHPANRRYLSGYTALDHGIQETAGVLLIPARGEPFLLTDSRYILQAREEARGFSVRLFARGLVPGLQKLLPELGVKNLGFESHYLLHSSAGRLAKLAASLDVKLVPFTEMIERLRVVKTEEEIARIRDAVLLNEKVFQKVYPAIRPGKSEAQIALAIENIMRETGADRPSFETIVAFGTNAAKPHAVPGDRILNKGETVLVDMG
ncbi:MAG TPA: aminopeptidase P family protein, partial [Desulfobacteraceae bacterium]|nr:aminopeptidase P family protein [Desulfobacteraceae bacterium]